MFDWSPFVDVAEVKSIEEKEEEFNNVVREYIINFLTFIALYLCAYYVLSRYHHRKERAGLFAEDEDARAYRISFHLCAFTLCVSFGSVFMLPMSMIGNEVVHLFPDSYWVQWLNGALIHTFWKWIFYLSNLSLFVLLPFSYFFTESEGFSGQRRGLMPRVYETIAVLLLLAVLVFGLAVLALAFFDNDDSAQGILLVVGEYYLQYLYSFLLGLCMLFIITGCAPLGFMVLFDAVGQVLVKPKIFENNDNRITIAKFEEEATRQKLKSDATYHRLSLEKREALRKDMEAAHKTRLKLERRKNASALERNLGYPLVMLCIIALTGLALFLVSFHVVKLVFFGDNELHPGTVADGFRKDYRNINREKACAKENVSEEPVKSYFWSTIWFSEDEKKEKNAENPCKNPSSSKLHSLGANSLSSFGILGTILEVLVIFYLTIASVVGLYNLPGFRLLKPEVRQTTMTKIILNCLLMQLLSSSLPVLSRVLGLTDFELQGNFGDLYWLGNFYLVFAFNVLFALVTGLCLVNKMTKKMRKALLKALRFNAFPSVDWRSGWQSKSSTIGSAITNKSLISPACCEPGVTSNRKSDDVLEETSKNLEETTHSLENKMQKFNKILQAQRILVEEKPSFCCTPSRTNGLTLRISPSKEKNPTTSEV